jgi:hypothetical protein
MELVCPVLTSRTGSHSNTANPRKGMRLSRSSDESQPGIALGRQQHTPDWGALSVLMIRQVPVGGASFAQALHSRRRLCWWRDPGVSAQAAAMVALQQLPAKLAGVVRPQE